MALRKWAFFYFSENFTPENNTAINTNPAGTCEFVTVGFSPGSSNDELILSTAEALYNEGVQMIELCGGFGPTWVTRLCEHLNYAIPVGGVAYGPEFRQSLLDINGTATQKALRRTEAH